MRMNPPPLQITPKVLTVLKWLAETRFMDSQMIKALLSPDSRRSSPQAKDFNQYSRRLLQRLREAGLIEVPLAYRAYRALEEQAPYVYGLTDEGARVLRERLGWEVTGRRWSQNNRRFRNLLQMKHYLMRARFLVCLERACRESGQAELVPWQEGRPLSPEQWCQLPESLQQGTRLWLAGGEVKVTVRMLPEEGRRAGPGGYRRAVIPDAFLGLYFKDRPKQANTVFVAVEIETGTRDTMKAFLHKMRLHWQAWKERAYEKRFGIQRHRVLILTPTEATKENRRRATKQADDRRQGSEMFLFTSEERYSLTVPQALFEEIWQSPKDDRFHSIWQ